MNICTGYNASTRWRGCKNLSLSALLLFVVCMLQAQAALPLAGARIDNQATAQWLNPDSGLQETIKSNTVSVETLPQEGAVLTIDQDAVKAPGEEVSFQHQLENTGNTPLELSLVIANLNGDAYDLQDLRLVEDLNGNGIADFGEPEISPANFIDLPVGATVNLVVVGTVPSFAPTSSTARLELIAQTPSGDVQLLNTDTVKTVGDAELVMEKTLLTTEPKVGELLSYELRASNRGALSAQGTAITIDGAAAPAPLVLIRDDIPANTVYDSVVDNGEGQLLFRLLGSAEFDFVSVEPIDLRQIVTVVYAVEPLAPDAIVTLTLNLNLSDNVSGRVNNQADLVTDDGTGGFETTDSNLVNADFPVQPPTITAFDTNQFSDPINNSRSGVPLYLETTAAQCNVSASVVDTHTITLTAFSGDTETVTARETGANTGIFRVVPPVPTTVDAVNADNGIMELGFSDEITAVVTGCGTPTETRIEYVPSGTVYDSRSNEPVEGARVVLIDVTGAGNGGNPGGPADVFAVDGVTLLSNEILTDASGVFQFPRVLPSTYRIEVFSPLTEEYIFPSILPPPDQPPGRLIPEAILGEQIGPSFGGLFELGDDGPIVLDIPLDKPAAGLGVAVTIDDDNVDIGDLVRTTVTITNFSDVDLDNGTLRLKLPSGFELQGGSVLINGNRVDDPVIEGNELLLPLGTLASGAASTPDVVTFLMQAGAGARGGPVSVCVEADGAAPAVANSQPISLRLEQFHGYIFGKIYLDCDRDRIQGVEEPGIPGVRVFMEDGTFVVTDAEGKYNFYGISPGLHILKLDRTTLPNGSNMITLDNRQAGDAHSRFVDLKRNEFHKANFAEGRCAWQVKEEVSRRRAVGEVANAELQNSLEQPFTVDSRRPDTIDARRLPSSSSEGAATGPGPGYGAISNPTTGNSAVLPEGQYAVIDRSQARGVRPSERTLENPDGKPVLSPGSDRSVQLDGEFPVVDLSLSKRKDADGNIIKNPASGIKASVPEAAETLDNGPDEEPELDFASLNNKTAFIGVKDGQVMPIPRITLRAKGSSDGTLALTLNGEPVSDKKVGLRMRDESRKLVLQEWVSLTLEPGPNELTLSLIDPFGNPRNTQSVTVMAPGKLAKIIVNVNDDGVPADIRNTATIEVLLHDKDGVPVTTPIAVTIESDRGRWLEDDVQPREPGLQVIVEGGRAELKLAAPDQAGDAHIRAVSGVQSGEAELAFLPPLRDMLVVGLIEGELGRRTSNSRDLSFERDLENFTTDTGNRNRAAARSAVFAKGRVGTSTLLTLSYDSEKNKGLRLFRDIRPDEFYPVYGDAATRGFDARSSSKLFLRLDRGQSYLQYGDFNSGQRDPAVSLGRFNRSLTGISHHLEKGAVEVNAFASRSRTTQEIVQIRGRGVSGPYRLGTTDIEENSERIELVTLDREVLREKGVFSDEDIEESRNLGTSIELRTVSLARFTDYIVDYETGEIVFREPISSLDSNLNPQLIRVTFEQEREGKRFWVAGVNGQLQVNEKVSVGAGYARDENPDNEYQLASVNATVKISEKTKLVTEYALSDSAEEEAANDGDGRGDAYRIEVDHRGENVQGRVYYAKTDSVFENRSAGFGKGRREVGVRLSLALGDRTRLVTEWLNSRDLRSGDKRVGTSIGLERTLTDNLHLEMGYRSSRDSGSSSTRNADSVRLKISGQMPKFQRTSVFIEAEQDLDDSKKQVLALGLDYRMSDRSRLYARHEFISSLGGRFALDSNDERNNSVVGMDFGYSRDGQVFSEYRLRDASNGADAEAAIGLRNRWELADGVRLNASLERVATLQGDSGSDATSVAFGLEYTANPLWKGTARLEFRDTDSGDSWFSTLGFASKLNRNWTFLGRNTLSLQNRSSSKELENRLQFGFALRPVDSDRWNALMRYEFNWRENTPTDETLANPKDRRLKHLWSASYNFQPRRSFILSGHYSGKSVRDRFGEESNVSVDAHLFSLRVGYYMSERWDLGLLASSYYTDDFREQRHGLGAEVGFLLHSNLWVTAGYNWFGYEDSDLSAADYREEGAYVRLRFKFDERLFDDLGRKPSTEAGAY